MSVKSAAISVRSLSPFGERAEVRGYRALESPYPLTPSLSLWERELTEPAAKSLVDTNSNVSGAGRMQVLGGGAGAVGLAVARAAAIAGHDVVVAEGASGMGAGVSSRNSEVIHAGLYYPTGSRRAFYCPRGRRVLYEFCASHGVPHRKCGKLVVATNAGEIERLEAVLKQAQINDVEGVEIIDSATAKRLEPALACVAAMHSPETGIIDSHRYMLALRGGLEDRGGMIAFNSPIERLRPVRGGWEAAVGGGAPPVAGLDAVVICAGPGPAALAPAAQGHARQRVPRLVLAKGH